MTTFLLLAGSAVAAPVLNARPSAKTDPLEKVRCVKEQITGSLMSTRRICHTERDWSRIGDASQDEVGRLAAPKWSAESN